MTIRNTLALAIALALAAPQALAGNHKQQPLLLSANQTSLMTLQETPGTVVVGNPAIADVTVEGKQLLLHGRYYGTTNVMLLDKQGNLVNDFEVTVGDTSSTRVTLYRGAIQPFTYSCAGDCEFTLNQGDNRDHFQSVASEIAIISSYAKGEKASDGSGNVQQPPPAP